MRQGLDLDFVEATTQHTVSVLWPALAPTPQIDRDGNLARLDNFRATDVGQETFETWAQHVDAARFETLWIGELFELDLFYSGFGDEHELRRWNINCDENATPVIFCPRKLDRTTLKVIYNNLQSMAAKAG
jgi:hypothetical protein